MTLESVSYIGKDRKQVSWGVKDLLASPRALMETVNTKGCETGISQEGWVSINALSFAVAKNIHELIRLDDSDRPECFTLQPFGGDSMFFVLADSKDPHVTHSVSISEYEDVYFDPEKRSRITTRSNYFETKIVTRRQYLPNVFIASDFRYRISGDYKFIEGDITNKGSFQRGALSSRETFLEGLYTNSQTGFIEITDADERYKTTVPLILDEGYLAFFENEKSAALLYRILTNTEEDRDWSKLRKMFHSHLQQYLVNQLSTLSQVVYTDATLRSNTNTLRTPVSTKYLDQLFESVCFSNPIAILPTHLPTVEYDPEFSHLNQLCRIKSSRVVQRFNNSIR